MIRILLLVLSTGLFNCSSSRPIAQEPLPCVQHLDAVTQTEYYMYVDVMPGFPGGREELDRFFADNFKAPRQVEDCCIFAVEFIVDVQGEIKNIVITPGTEPDFDAEALRVLQMMPRWNPGKCSNKEVPVKMTVMLYSE